MRVTFLFFSMLITCLLSVRATDLNAQGMRTRISISFKHETLSSVVKKIEDKAGVTFAFDEAYLRLADKYVGPGTYDGQTVETILAALMPGQDIGFKEQGSNIPVQTGQRNCKRPYHR